MTESEIIKKRIRKIRRDLKKYRSDAVLINYAKNVTYVTGIPLLHGFALISADKQLFITDFIYREPAEKNLLGWEIGVMTRRNTLSGLINEFCRANKIKRLGFEESTTTQARYVMMAKKLRGLKLVPAARLMNDLRLVKDDVELARIRKAAFIADKALKETIPLIKPGIREREIAAELEYRMKLAGADGPSFETIAIGGKKTSSPHGVPDDTKLKKGGFLTIDMGALYQGYCSDHTRTFGIGDLTKKHREIYSVVRQAQKAGLDAIRSGVTCGAVDKAARDVIDKAGYGPRFGHSTGHGVGLDIHESPRLSPGEKTRLRVGMVVTVEPGIYIPDFGGVRIEDIVIVTRDGCEILSKTSKKLRIL